MTPEPFAYGIQAPIGSVTPLFHKLKDAEDYIAKLTDSRDEAKIIPLYRSPLYALSGNAETVDWTDIAETGRAHADNLIGEPGITKLMHLMADEIERLRLTDAEPSAWSLFLNGKRARVICEKEDALRFVGREPKYTLAPLYDYPPQPTLTDAERSVLAMLVECARTHNIMFDEEATLRGLLERTEVTSE